MSADPLTFRETHPIRRPEVQESVERWTALVLQEGGGTGRVAVEFDYKDGHYCGFSVEGRQVKGRDGRKHLTARPRGG